MRQPATRGLDAGADDTAPSDIAANFVDTPATPASADTTTPPPTTTLVAAEDGGGAGALDWPAVLLLLPLLFLRRNARAKARVALR